MRPRRIRRGEAAAAAAHAALQCGHGEFAVEKRVVRLQKPSEVMTLQCGHGEFAVEKLRREPKRLWEGITLQCGHGEFAVEK